MTMVAMPHTYHQKNLLDADRTTLGNWLSEWGEPSFRAQQIVQWIHHYGVTDFDAMTNLSKSLRARLNNDAVITFPEIVEEQCSSDGTRKWVLKLHDGQCIETVYIPEADRGTLCVSSQVGCALNCSFCSTAQQGFNRNLSVGEIIGQVWVAVRRLSTEAALHDRHVTNVVMMGMGEPLLNIDAVISAMDLMRDDFAYGLSKRRVTLSTSGVVPAMLELKQRSDVALAVSLHAPTNALRDELVPINRKYPLEVLMPVCREYFPKNSRRRITFEYVMLDGVNDSLTHAKQLIRLMDGMPGMVNLIPFNPFPQTQYRRSSDAAIDAFADRLRGAGIMTITRKTRGDDIDAACGQLVGEVQDRTARRRLKIPMVSDSPDAA